MTTDRRSCAVNFPQDRDCSPAGETRMNANHSFRTSISVLTVTTIVGTAVMLVSGFSQFRLRPALNDKALISTANQKLRNRFGEFYPVETRTPLPSGHSSPDSVIHSTSTSSTFDEVITATSEYDHSEVVKSWSHEASPGTPQVSVPVTINVNNGELMAQLIETRESLAEVKAQQSAIRQDQRVFSYQVHNNDQTAATASAEARSTTESANVTAARPVNASNVPSASDAVVLGDKVVSSESHKSISSAAGSLTAKQHLPSEANSGTKELAGRSTSRMRTISETGTVHEATQSIIQAPPSADSRTPLSSKPVTATVPAMDSEAKTEADGNHEFEAFRENSTTTDTSVLSIEEKVSFEPAPQPPAAARDEEPFSVPVIEPISYYIEETVEESSTVTESENTTVQFGPLDSDTVPEAPSALPELNLEEVLQEQTPELPALSPHQGVSAAEPGASRDAGKTDKSNAEPRLPDFFADHEEAAFKKNGAIVGPPAEVPMAGNPGRTREELATAFAAVRGLPPEDLFTDRSTPFVSPIEPAEPSNLQSADGVGVVSSELNTLSQENLTETAPPTISFGDSSTRSLFVHPSSAASPVDLEFGEASVSSPALSLSENPGRPETPALPPTEMKEERWHKYRSRIRQRQTPGPATPVPPVPEIARTPVPEIPSPFSQEPALVPPSLENSLLESGNDETISDSPLMIPDEDGATEVAQNSDSKKLDSTSLPPIPPMDPVQELAPVPELPVDATEADHALVYEPQPVMDSLDEISRELNSPPVFSSPPSVIAQRKMPTKSAGKLPFETSFRRIHKRVAWMADAMNLPEKKTARQHQEKPMRPGTPVIERPQPTPHPPTQSRSQAIAKKSSPSKPIQLPKLNVPKFTVQNFSLPNVHFRAIQPPSFQMPMLETPDWLACPPDVMAPVRNSTTVHRVISTMQFAGQPKVLN